jgi:hypothetical protein
LVSANTPSLKANPQLCISSRTPLEKLYFETSNSSCFASISVSFGLFFFLVDQQHFLFGLGGGACWRSVLWIVEIVVLFGTMDTIMVLGAAKLVVVFGT